jgi:hypothetical protein
MRTTRGKATVMARAGFVAGVMGLLLCAVLGLLVIVPAVSPNTGAAIADWIREIAGPRPVAFLETQSLSIQDALNHVLAAHGAAKQLSLLPNPTVVYAPQAQQKPAASVAAGVAKPAIPADALPNAVTAAPQIGWQPIGPAVNANPAMAEAMVALDPTRSYAGIVLVRIDLSLLRLHMMPGTSESSHAPSVVSALPDRGVIPPADQANLVAGFNGGFKAINGQYGMMVSCFRRSPGLPRSPSTTMAGSPWACGGRTSDHQRIWWHSARIARR